MSHTAHIPSHRKPRRSASKLALRAGVAGGVLSTIAVAGAAGPANAEPVTETIEMPTLNGDLSADLSSAVAASAEATQQIALDQELQAQEDAAAAKAAKEAKKAKAEAERKAEAEEAQRKAEAKAKAEAEAAERASRSSERTTLSASTGSEDDGGSSYDSGQATGSAAAIVAFARAQVGDAYVMGSTGPNSWDCSGLVQAAYRQAGIELPRVSGDQSSRGTSVSLDNLQPGDILYWGSRSNSYHVAIYVGGGMFVGAQNPGTGVVERSLDYDPPSGAVRIL
ncbi:NlpC/P60 family protein [Streptomyces sp. WAC05374]|uniref:C40 family peptidase n=1 Tax=Streptomyces sp. WAC05374 TaxID=2487420 RepID=UPI000F8716F0|nr:C40 family peptidase [Streptomyces sp. WAC05374]RST15360.1 NlpC/P60 family protein [Streptomyces sp. WAC05374]TDF40463.1 NlpC/P60 family protein [Streptomyces sp. WAC05374]TDF49097.1 NlpC/P60 family protein [Streptomyces sp. WAC05374]TDF49583.1 NlpC/P60 family protein [Streptomyces sp. WAC05374]